LLLKGKEEVKDEVCKGPFGGRKRDLDQTVRGKVFYVGFNERASPPPPQEMDPTQPEKSTFHQPDPSEIFSLWEPLFSRYRSRTNSFDNARRPE